MKEFHGDIKKIVSPNRKGTHQSNAIYSDQASRFRIYCECQPNFRKRVCRLNLSWYNDDLNSNYILPEEDICVSA